MKNVLFVAVGGAAGSVARFLLVLLSERAFTSAEVGTLAVNVLGSLILGFLVGGGFCDSRDQGSDQLSYVFLITGVLGGFTTFSAFSGQVAGLIQVGRAPMAMLHAVGHLVLGVACVFLGERLGRIVA